MMYPLTNMKSELNSISKFFFSPIQVMPVIGSFGGLALGSLISTGGAILGGVLGFVFLLIYAIYEQSLKSEHEIRAELAEKYAKMYAEILTKERTRIQKELSNKLSKQQQERHEKYTALLEKIRDLEKVEREAFYSVKNHDEIPKKIKNEHAAIWMASAMLPTLVEAISDNTDYNADFIEYLTHSSEGNDEIYKNDIAGFKMQPAL